MMSMENKNGLLGSKILVATRTGPRKLLTDTETDISQQRHSMSIGWNACSVMVLKLDTTEDILHPVSRDTTQQVTWIRKVYQVKVIYLK